MPINTIFGDNKKVYENTNELSYFKGVWVWEKWRTTQFWKRPLSLYTGLLHIRGKNGGRGRKGKRRYVNGVTTLAVDWGCRGRTQRPQPWTRTQNFCSGFESPCLPCSGNARPTLPSDARPILSFALLFLVSLGFWGVFVASHSLAYVFEWSLCKQHQQQRQQQRKEASRRRGETTDALLVPSLFLHFRYNSVTSSSLSPSHGYTYALVLEISWKSLSSLFSFL